MSTEQNNQNKNKPTPQKKFNFYWIYAVIAAVLIAFMYFPFEGNPVELKDIKKFNTEMLQKGDVNRIVIVNDDYAEIYIKEDRLTNEPYKKDKVPKKVPSINIRLPHRMPLLIN